MKLRTYILRFVAALLVAYGAVIAWFSVEEDSFIYHPERALYRAPDPALLLAPRKVRLKTQDGVSLAAWAIAPPPSLAAGSAPWLLYCHGNSGNLGTLGYHQAWSRMRALGLGILAVDYRGYGESAGAPSEQGLYRDAEAAYAYLRDELKVPASHIIFYGFSLGSAVAIDLASRLEAGGLITEGAFLSVPHRAQELYPFLPVFSIAKNRFASIDKIDRVRMPKLFIHSKDDEVNPISHSKLLHARAPAPKTFVQVSGLHASAYKTDRRFMASIAGFLVRLGSGRKDFAL